MNTPLHPVPMTVEGPPNCSEQEGALKDMLNDETGVVVAYPSFLDELHVKKEKPVPSAWHVATFPIREQQIDSESLPS